MAEQADDGRRMQEILEEMKRMRDDVKHVKGIRQET